MILKSLSLKNFKQYTELNLNFRDGLVGIVGRNGSGKSSIFEAVLVCLYGYIPSKDFVRSSWAGDKAPVELELFFEIENKTYRAKREFRGKALTHQAGLYDYQDQMIATGAKPVNEEVSKLIGMDKDAFTRSIFSGQKELGELSNTKGEERRRMVRKMVGLEKLDDIQKIVRKDRNSIREQIKGQSNLLLTSEVLAQVESSLKQLSADKKIATNKSKELEKTLAQNTKIYLQAKTHFDRQNELYKSFNELSKDLIRFQKAVENFQIQTKEKKEEKQQLESLKKQLQQQEDQFKNFEHQKAQLKQLEKDKAQFDQLKKLQVEQKHFQTRLKEIQNEAQLLLEATKNKPALNKDLHKYKDALHQINANQENLQKELSQLAAQRGGIEGKIQERDQRIQTIESLGKEAACPTCSRPLLDAYEDILENLKTELHSYQQKDLIQLNKSVAKITAEYNLLKEKESATENSKQKLLGELKVLETKADQLNHLSSQEAQLLKQLSLLEENIRSLGTLKFDLQAYHDLRQAIEHLEQDYINYQKQLREIEKIADLEAKISLLDERIKNGSVKIQAQEKTIAALQFSPNHHQQAKIDQDKAENTKDETLQAIKRHEASYLELDRQILSAQNQLKAHQDTLKIIDQNNQELAKLEELDNIFSEFKTTILDRVKPTISYNASQLFQQITKGRYEGIHVDDNFEFHITEDGKAYPITRFSGGEIDLANLCLRIGISRAISELSGNSSGMNFLGFDEIFGSQDEERRFEILLALDLLKEQYRQIYIISHIDTVKEHFPSILEVRNSAKGSLINWL